MKYVLLALSLLFPGSAFAQDFPAKRLTLIVPFAAGGAGDIIARPTADRLAKELGVQVLVENRPGAQGVIGTAQVARATPDGYTIGLQFATMSAQRFFVKAVPYDPTKDLTPIYRAARAPQVLVVQ